MAYTYGNTQKAAERIKEISGVNPLKCMKCGICSATCPAFNEMDIKPHHRTAILKPLHSQNPYGNASPALHV